MATISAPPLRNRDDSQRRVASPLQRLRGYIQFYVSAEGASVLLLYVALWFWLGLLLDYGFFKLFAIDWVQVLAHGFRVAVLAILTGGLLVVVASQVLQRLAREFRPPSLALVLERRFPQQLGDRLITAVELADPRIAARYGYSQAMIDHTIHDAADRVGRVPVTEVFNWRRLWRYGLLVALLTVGLYLLVGAAFCGYHAVKPLDADSTERREGAGDFVVRFHEIATIWIERNILLRDTIWPRRAHLVLLDFAEEEKHLGRDAPPLTLHVRALKWVVADTDRQRAPEGWRALRWDEGELSSFLPGVALPALPPELLPSQWRGTVDEVELLAAKENLQKKLDVDAIHAVLGRLETLAASPRMNRQLRRLEVPDSVQVIYKDLKDQYRRNEQTLQKQGDNEYSGNLPELKESIRFTVRGEDYYTPYKRILVEPPPQIENDGLARDEAQPAYLHYRLPRGANPGELRGKKQQVRNIPISLTGDTSRFDVPAGTDVLLTARVDKDLRLPGGVRIRPRQGNIRLDIPVEQLDRRTFRVRFANVTVPIDVLFEFIDPYDVVGLRHMILKPVDDATPEVDVQIEVVRKTNQGYLVTPSARIPFSGKVRDDRGISFVDYQYTLERIDTQPSTGVQAAKVAAAVPLGGGGLAQNLAALALLSTVAAAEEPEKAPEQAPVTSFDKKLAELPEIPLARLPQLLAVSPADSTEKDRRFLREFPLDPDGENFNVEKLGLKVTDERALQPRYRLRLWVLATDSNIETGPQKGQSKEKFTVLIVSENELLAEIAKEEEALHIKLEEAVTRLKDGRLALEKVIQEMPKLQPDEFRAVSRRTEEVGETVVKSGDVSREVLADYRRILKELETNRVQRGMIDRVSGKICDPLDLAVSQDFPRAEEALREYQKSLEGKNRSDKLANAAMDSLQNLIDRLNTVLDNMAVIEGINKLITRLVEIEKSEADELKKLEKLKEKLEDDLLKSLLK